MKTISKQVTRLLLSLLVFSAVFATSIPITAAAACTAHGALQDAHCTPGATLPVTAKQVCVSGYSKSVRNVSEATKKAVFTKYGITSHPTGAYEVDHLISLELGGSNDIKNLWPEAASPTPGFHQKDTVENYLHSQVCAGKMSLVKAQHAIVTNWLSVYGTISKGTAASKTTVTSSTSQPAVKKSSSGLCHAKGTKYYNQTKTFKSYPSVAACLASGGKLSKN